jgi:murein DD-endopeptidase MepM/ murein hydrolase activator NlpD
MRLWGFFSLILFLAFAIHAQEGIGESNLAGDNPPIYLADGFDMPVGTAEERHSRDLWASDWDSRWSFGIPQNGELSAGIVLFASGSGNRPIYAPASGIVIFAEEIYPFGKIIIIHHDPLFRTDGLQIYSRLAGLNELSASLGNRVERGDLLGESPSQMEFALTASPIFEENPLSQPGSPEDLAPFLDPYLFIAEHRPRLALRYGTFAFPLEGEISQTFSTRHPAIDIDAPEGTPILAMAEGLVIRRMDCTDCERVFPCRRQQYQDAVLGYGYGNFLIVRYEALLMPSDLRAVMEAYDARYAYLLYAHLSESYVDYGDMLDEGTNIAAVGSSACVSAASLHLELRIGNDESVDGHWQEQIPIDPFVLF